MMNKPNQVCKGFGPDMGMGSQDGPNDTPQTVSRLDELVLMAGPKPMVTEFAIYHELKHCYIHISRDFDQWQFLVQA